MLSPLGLALTLLLAQAGALPAVPSPEPPPAPETKPTPDGPVIALETSMGTIQIGLWASKARASTRNIMSYVKSGHYAGTIFHRVIPGFMIQGGGMDAKLGEKPMGPPVRNEARNGLLNTRGAVALARTDDPHSATAQFFINLKDNPMLDFGVSRDGWGYAVFGEVLSGMDVVDRIAQAPTSRSGRYDNVPLKPIVITRVRVISEPSVPTSPAVTKTGVPAGPKPGPAAAAPKPAPTVRPKPTPTPLVR